MRPPLASWLRRLESGVLVFGALAGALSIGWLLLAPVMGLSLVVLRTGSMAPTMPQGTAAVARTVPAAQVHVGDVVTVRRDASSPLITHRVVRVSRVAGSAQARVLALKGDANDTVDHLPYEVDHVLRTSWSLPGAGTALARAQHPVALAGLVLGIGLLVLRAFWPASPPVIPAEPGARTPREEDGCATADHDSTGSSSSPSRRS